MDQFYFSVNLGEGRELCLAPLTDRRITMSGEDVFDASGYFLFEKNGVGENATISVIARAISDEAALRLREIFQMN